ncbi:MAG TPA: hypothetical protein VNM22_20095 [Candidatus Limnocylindrales bacterium]|nr:hypothetical protein [Candidatus Limnocylindrales bacterium]
MNFKGTICGLSLVLGIIAVGYAQSPHAEEEEAVIQVVKSYYENWKFNLWNAMVEVFADTSGSNKTDTLAAYSKEKIQLDSYKLTRIKWYNNPLRAGVSVKLKLRQNSLEKEVSDSITLIKVGREWKFQEQPTYNPGTNLTRKKPR